MLEWFDVLFIIGVTVCKLNYTDETLGSIQNICLLHCNYAFFFRNLSKEDVLHSRIRVLERQVQEKSELFAQFSELHYTWMKEHINGIEKQITHKIENQLIHKMDKQFASQSEDTKRLIKLLEEGRSEAGHGDESLCLPVQGGT